MTPERVARLIQKELARADGPQQELECLYAAERLVQNYLEGAEPAPETSRFEELLAEIQALIRERST